MMSRMKDICLRHGCIRCCLNTEMPLSLLDIDRIKGLGFAEDFFLDVVSGSRQLKNLSGRCVFHNGQQCTIYTDRPEGCQLYPVIFDEDKGQAVLDSYCPYHDEFQLTPSISRKLVRLVRKLDMEKTKG
jgi:Fe-S-cluster containining protein